MCWSHKKGMEIDEVGQPELKSQLKLNDSDKMKWQISKKGSHLLSKIENYIIHKEIDLNLID